MKTIERLLQEYRIRFRDTELIKRDGYPFEDRYISNHSEGGYEPIVCESEVWNINGQVYGGGGKWATADLKEKPDKWVIEKDESHPMWEMFKAWYLGKYAFLCDLDFNEYRFFAVQFYDEEITAFERHQYLTLDQWAEFFLPKKKGYYKKLRITHSDGKPVDSNADYNDSPKVDFSILNDTDWFYVKTIEEREWVGKGNIIERNTDKCIHYCITMGNVYYNTRKLINEGDILLLRKATPEDLAPMFKKYPELTPPKVGDWGLTYDGELLEEMLHDISNGIIILKQVTKGNTSRTYDNFYKIDLTKNVQEQIDEFLKQKQHLCKN